MNLEIKNIRCGYNGHSLIGPLSASVSRGEVLCIMGSNGVGKTTFLKTLLGFLPRIGGNVTLHGEDLKFWSRKKMARYLGYVPQSHIPPFPFRVLDVVVMGRVSKMRSFSNPSAHDFRESERALASLNILHLKDRIYTELSGGERQMVLIARALTQKPEILLMDEPTASLDFSNQVRVLEQINKLAETGLSIIMTSHSPDQAFRCNAKVILLCKDNKYQWGTARQIVTEQNLRSAYGVEVKISDIQTPEGRIRTCVPVIRQKYKKLMAI